MHKGSSSEISGFFAGKCPRLVAHTRSVSVRVPNKGGRPGGPSSCVTGGGPACLKAFAARTEQRMLRLASEATGRSEQECKVRFCF
jgi:hypothetical protein